MKINEMVKKQQLEAVNESKKQQLLAYEPEAILCLTTTCEVGNSKSSELKSGHQFPYDTLETMDFLQSHWRSIKRIHKEDHWSVLCFWVIIHKTLWNMCLKKMRCLNRWLNGHFFFLDQNIALMNVKAKNL